MFRVGSYLEDHPTYWVVSNPQSILVLWKGNNPSYGDLRSPYLWKPLITYVMGWSSKLLTLWEWVRIPQNHHTFCSVWFPQNGIPLKRAPPQKNQMFQLPPIQPIQPEANGFLEAKQKHRLSLWWGVTGWPPVVEVWRLPGWVCHVSLMFTWLAEISPCSTDTWTVDSHGPWNPASHVRKNQGVFVNICK